MLKTIKHKAIKPEPGLENLGLSPLLQRIYAARGIASAQQLDLSLKHLLPPQFLGLDAALDLLQQALVQQQRILIVGDFDADGATSSALAVRLLRDFGFESVDFLVPNRFEFGYGLSPEIVDVAAERRPDLLITVDNGISSHSGVAKAKALGIRVLVTDHHLPGATLPNADAIVNPNQHGCDFASKNLAGVGVVFYLLSAFRSRLRQQDWFVQNQRREPNLVKYLDIVALGTVADVVTLDHNNRVLVNRGISLIRQGQCCFGIAALLAVASRNKQRLVAADLGFAIAPRLNAAGRLDDMSIGIRCLLADSWDEALALAQQLDSLNQSRKSIEAEMQDQALAELNDNLGKAKNLPSGLCIYEDSWHQGVIGILASRIKERFHRPVIAFAPDIDQNSETPEDIVDIKGSARSIPGLHIRDVLAAVDSKNPDLISKFGGHAMAAGLSLAQRDYDRFCRLFNEEVEQQLAPGALEAVAYSDGVLTGDELQMQVAQSLREAGPWGQNFPEPIFDNFFELIEQRIVGERHLKLTLAHEDLDYWLDAIAFNVDLRIWPNRECRQVHVLYKLDVNEFRGKQTLQLMVDQLRRID